MKKGLVRLGSVALLLTLFCNVGYAQSKVSNKKVLFVILDGIPTDIIKKVYTPHINKITAEGSLVNAFVGGEKGGITQSPTISAVGYNSLLTGTWANKHNVWDNDIKDPDYKYWTIFRMMRFAKPQSKLAIYSTWEDNRTKLLGEGKELTGSLKLDFAFDGYEKDTILFPHDPYSRYILLIDEFVVNKAHSNIDIEGPDLSWVYLEYTDDIGHRYGDGKEMEHAVQIADGQVGLLYAAIQSRMKKYNEDWLIIITTDHGRDLTGKGHGGQSDRERNTWIACNKRIKNDSKLISIVDIVPSIIQFLGLNIPTNIISELDGHSFLIVP